MRCKLGRRSLWARRHKARICVDGDNDYVGGSEDYVNDSVGYPDADDSVTDPVDVISFCLLLLHLSGVSFLFLSMAVR